MKLRRSPSYPIREDKRKSDRKVCFQLFFFLAKMRPRASICRSRSIASDNSLQETWPNPGSLVPLTVYPRWPRDSIQACLYFNKRQKDSLQRKWCHAQRSSGDSRRLYQAIIGEDGKVGFKCGVSTQYPETFSFSFSFSFRKGKLKCSAKGERKKLFSGARVSRIES